MEMHGWRLFAHPLFLSQYQKLADRVLKLAGADPKGYPSHPSAKLLATVHHLILEAIPSDPGAAAFRQGNTLGPGNRHWFRAKFHGRYRLFFRFSSEAKIIIYAWVNDEGTLRKTGAKSDPYQVFQSMLEAGDPPRSFPELIRRSKKFTARLPSAPARTRN
jgi:toxin YhaV